MGEGAETFDLRASEQPVSSRWDGMPELSMFLCKQPGRTKREGGAVLGMHPSHLKCPAPPRATQLPAHTGCRSETCDPLRVLVRQPRHQNPLACLGEGSWACRAPWMDGCASKQLPVRFPPSHAPAPAWHKAGSRSLSPTRLQGPRLARSCRRFQLYVSAYSSGSGSSGQETPRIPSKSTLAIERPYRDLSGHSPRWTIRLSPTTSSLHEPPAQPLSSPSIVQGATSDHT
ncbi:uncharacterized protein B0I36DRAFT_27417 [Microdochium trichocladiopsis]|uniref:Uncharacterized protein n=1 Tax=Microdochium trichocladiopsis TaxID=1682393 RepID=A0A9P9BK99_9PEZI|nr:uncharacterized protein B0I36DRAFT_27417 [Microdochium trichocladiopsis]KAH7020966.1 hypothetical protein B0I36DRAFT_27417 [Microdochium trichocladiopsis]